VRYIIVVTAPDGSTSAVGPYTSETRAQLHASRILDYFESDATEGSDPTGSADVHELDTPTEMMQIINPGN
jgi:hypothetical protein